MPCSSRVTAAAAASGSGDRAMLTDSKLNSLRSESDANHDSFSESEFESALRTTRSEFSDIRVDHQQQQQQQPQQQHGSPCLYTLTVSSFYFV